MGSPDVIAYNTVINACSKARKPTWAIMWLDAMEEKKLRPTVRSYTSAISACVHMDPGSKSRVAEELFQRMLDSGLKPDEFVSGVLARVKGSSARNSPGLL